jgi:hypothetical protein
MSIDLLMKQIDLQSSHQLIFKPLKKDNTIHLLVMGHHPLIWPETLNRSCQSSLRVPACKTIKRLPFPEGIFGASDPSLEVLTKYVTVMLLIVLAEAALR